MIRLSTVMMGKKSLWAANICQILFEYLHFIKASKTTLRVLSPFYEYGSQDLESNIEDSLLNDCGI